MENEKIYRMKFSKIYELLINKAVEKDRNSAEMRNQYVEMPEMRKRI